MGTSSSKAKNSRGSDMAATTTTARLRSLAQKAPAPPAAALAIFKPMHLAKAIDPGPEQWLTRQTNETAKKEWPNKKRWRTDAKPQNQGELQCRTETNWEILLGVKAGDEWNTTTSGLKDSNQATNCRWMFCPGNPSLHVGTFN